MRKKLYQAAIGSVKMHAQFIQAASADWLREELPAGVTAEKWRAVHADFVMELFTGIESLARFWERRAETAGIPAAMRERLRERWLEIGRERLRAAAEAAELAGSVFCGEKLVVP